MPHSSNQLHKLCLHIRLGQFLRFFLYKTGVHDELIFFISKKQQQQQKYPIWTNNKREKSTTDILQREDKSAPFFRVATRARKNHYSRKTLTQVDWERACDYILKKASKI